MTGDDRVRFCGQCRLHVYDISALTRDEFQGAVRQVSNLHRTWGTSYSSTELFYGTTQEPAPEEEP